MIQHYSSARIGGGGLIGSLREVATCVERFAVQRQRDEEILANAPEEFLDPIMSTLMMDPVILPSSRTVVDRTTIARYDRFFILASASGFAHLQVENYPTGT